MQAIDSELDIRTRLQNWSWVGECWPVLLLTLFTTALYTPVLDRLVRQWFDDPNYSHGFFVLPFSGYLIWSQRHRIAAIKSDPSAGGAILVFMSLAILYLGSLGSELFLQRIS